MGRTRTRTRKVGGGDAGSQTTRYDRPVGSVNRTDKFYTLPTFTSSETCSDEVHRGPPYKDGGPLSVSKTTYKFKPAGPFNSDYKSPYYKRAVNVRFWPANTSLPAPAAAKSTSGLGAEAWGRMCPVSPILSLGNALIELREFPAMIIQSQRFLRDAVLSKMKFTKNSYLKVRDLRNKSFDLDRLSGDYLNLQFGWVPFIKDLVNALTFQDQLAKKIAQLKKDNGKSVRRRRTLRKESYRTGSSTTYDVPAAGVSPTLDSIFIPGTYATTTDSSSYSRNAWCSGRFRYFIPELADPNNKSHLWLKLDMLGLTLDPVVIYNAMPWTWLLDWFVNTGHVLKNATARAKYHVVADYAYVMQSETITATREVSFERDVWSETVPQVAKPQAMSASISRVTQYKSRVEAHPYGFGVSDTSLSLYQWSILAALGLSRLSRK